MPHQDKSQKCYLDQGINLEWPKRSQLLKYPYLRLRKTVYLAEHIYLIKRSSVNIADFQVIVFCHDLFCHLCSLVSKKFNTDLIT